MSFQDKCRSHRMLESCPCRQLPNRPSINFSGCCQDLQLGKGAPCPSLVGHLPGILGGHLGCWGLCTSAFQNENQFSIPTLTHTIRTKLMNSIYSLKSRVRMKGRKRGSEIGRDRSRERSDADHRSREDNLRRLALLHLSYSHPHQRSPIFELLSLLFPST